MIVAALRDGILDGIIETGNILDPLAVFVGVFTEIQNNGLATVMANVTRPAGAMALGVAVTTWGSPHTLTDGRRVVDAPAKTFSPADATEGTVLTGWCLTTTAGGGTLLQFGYFAGPVPMPDENTDVTVIARVSVDPDGRWDATVSING